LTSSFENSRLVVQKTSLAIMPAVLWTNLITLILITLATIFVVLFVSHKIAGPLFRFEKELREIATGDLTKTIHLRKKDQITDMARELNTMTASLREKMLAIRSELEKTIESATRENASPELMEALNRLHRSMEMHFKI
jgi:methyl-accepting chemotaxis protein